MLRQDQDHLYITAFFSNQSRLGSFFGLTKHMCNFNTKCIINTFISVNYCVRMWQTATVFYFPNGNSSVLQLSRWFQSVIANCLGKVNLKSLNDSKSRGIFLVLLLLFFLGLLLFSSQPRFTHLLQGLAGVHDEGKRHSSSAITILTREAQEGCPEEGAAAHECCSHVQRHQHKV